VASLKLGGVGALSAPPRPHGALDDFMDAIEGDGSAWSYLSASLFAREAAELGALWHGELEPRDDLGGVT